MNDVHVEAFDLNLLLAFDALWTERHVTRAAKRVGLTQSAMSHALRRLREQLADPLFQATPRGLQPTARAHAVAPPVSEALALVRRAVARPAPFTPATLKRTFTLGTTDYGDMVLLPRLMARLVHEAPGVQLILRPVVDSGEQALVAGEHDLTIGVAMPGTSDVHSATLFADEFVSLLRADHPLAHQRLTLARFVALGHVLISPQGRGEASVDVALRQLGLTRRIALRVPHFLSAPLVVAESDLIVTLPARVAAALAGNERLIVRRPPLAVPGFTLSLFWHARNDDDEAHRWLRALVAEAARPLPAPIHKKGRRR
jgi:DNA-binding transcriptional LysR family regulator